jgi:hypothetical protein
MSIGISMRTSDAGNSASDAHTRRDCPRNRPSRGAMRTSYAMPLAALAVLVAALAADACEARSRAKDFDGVVRSLPVAASALDAPGGGHVPRGRLEHPRGLVDHVQHSSARVPPRRGHRFLHRWESTSPWSAGRWHVPPSARVVRSGHGARGSGRFHRDERRPRRPRSSTRPRGAHAAQRALTNDHTLEPLTMFCHTSAIREANR